MRAARTAAPGIFRLPIENILHMHPVHPDKDVADRTRARETASWTTVLLFGVLFFAGYLGGVLKGRTGQSDLGEQLADYYRTAEHFSAFMPLFLDLFGSALLQAVLVLACGFSALGTGFLGLYFIARGAVLGLCAACVFVQGGTKALVVHWMLTCLPDLSIFLVMLWLAVQASRCAGGVFRVLLGGGAHLRQTPSVRRLVLRFFVALLLCAVFCLIGSASGVLFAGVLL